LKRSYVVGLTVATALAVCSLLFFSFYSPANPPTPEPTVLKIYCAGSLLYPLERVATAFEAAYPTVDVEVEGHGSIQVIRHVTELGDEVDLLMVADYSLIPLMMYDRMVSDTSENFTDWYIRFAGNDIVLAYTNASTDAEELNATNWYDILRRPGVTFGFPNPLIDALGYRTLMVLQLAETQYADSRIFDDLVESTFSPRFTTVSVAEGTMIFVPEFLDPVGEKVLLRASSIQLIPLLQSGAIDYCFLYRSNAEQYNVEYISFPVEINLASPQFEALYQRVTIRYEHQRFGSVGLTREGKTIYYGLTIPENAPNPEGAEAFIQYLLTGEGRTIFTALHHPIFTPALTDNRPGLPEAIQGLVVQEGE
jgi:molybdate/tungstate transport system substrate-binding protein